MRLFHPSLSKNDFPCRGMEEFSRTPSKLLPILLLRLCIILWLPEVVLTPTDTSWKVTPGALQYEYPWKAKDSWTAADALQISVLSKPFPEWLYLVLKCSSLQCAVSLCLTFDHFSTLHALPTWPPAWQHSWSPTIWWLQVSNNSSFIYSYFHLWHHVKPTWNLSFMLSLWSSESIWALLLLFLPLIICFS